MNVKKEMPTGRTIERSFERHVDADEREQVVRRRDEEVEVLEVAEERDVPDDRRREEPLAAS